MTRQEARQTALGVIAEIAPNADLERLDGEENFRRELGLDSMDFLDVLTRLAEETGVEVPERDYDQIRTIDDLAGYIAERT